VKKNLISEGWEGLLSSNLQKKSIFGEPFNFLVFFDIVETHSPFAAQHQPMTGLSFN